MRRYRFIPVCLSSFALSVGLMAPGASHAAAPAAQEVVRVGDRDMSCQALAAEINTLAQPAAAAGEAAAKPKKHGFGFLKVLSAVTPLGGLAGGMGGAVLSSAAGAAQAAAATSAPADMMADSRRMAQTALAGGTPEQQRKERLTSIFEEKRC